MRRSVSVRTFTRTLPVVRNRFDTAAVSATSGTMATVSQRNLLSSALSSVFVIRLSCLRLVNDGVLQMFPRHFARGYVFQAAFGCHSLGREPQAATDSERLNCHEASW